MSRPTALPMRECFVGYAERTSASLFSAFGMWRSRACRTAIPATRAARSASATYAGRPSASISLKENGTVMRRPSNSGTATWLAASRGDRPSSFSSQAAREPVRHSACRIGTSSAASAPASQASSSPPACASAGLVPPAARTVVTIASAVRRVSTSSVSGARRDATYSGRARAPASSIAPHRASTKAVFPLMWWAR
ncbi:hypothetical protein STANM309S_00550 [Streptomyces tanashiensis]